MDCTEIHKILNPTNESTKPLWKEDNEVDVLVYEEDKKVILLHNDDVHTFDFVILSLIEVCSHTPEQAEQCTWLVHYKGKCEVKSGSYDFLEPMCSALLNRGLSAEIV